MQTQGLCFGTGQRFAGDLKFLAVFNGRSGGKFHSFLRS